VIKILLVILGAYFLVLVLAFFFQGRMVFFPDSRLAGTPASSGLDYEDVQLRASDGVELHGWFVPGPGGGATALFCHGNAGNISHRLEMLDVIHRLGLSCLMFDYRGYGKSQGTPSEQGLFRDAQAAWDWLLHNKNADPGRIVCWGRSLGGPIAARLARDNQPGALIIESTFTSLPDLGQKIYPFLPVKLISRLRFPTQKYLRKLTCPVLVVHSTEDEIVPFSFGERLFKAASEPKSFLAIHGGHNEGFIVSGETYIQGVQEFLRRDVGLR
jgi:hypothetical protein